MRTESNVAVIKPPAISAEGVLFCYSPNLGIRVRYGSLAIDLGRGRSLTVNRAGEPRLKRLVIAGHGWWTFEVPAWLKGIGASWTHLDLAGRVLGSGPGDISPDLPALRRAQALSAGTDWGIAIGMDLLTRKILGQTSALSPLKGTEETRQALRERVELLQGCSTVAELRTIEARAAVVFWQALAGVPFAFIPSDEAKVPRTWRSIGRRSSAVTGSPRGASTPAHAIWNFAYSIGAAEVEIALRSVGLDPGISATGLHADTNNRSAATWDVLEAVRGDIDHLIIAMIGGRRFRRREFAQLPDGRVRLTANLARELAEAVLPVTRQTVAPVAESLARTLAATVVGPRSHVANLPTSLSGDSRSRGRQGIRKGDRPTLSVSRRAAEILIRPACRRCGVGLVLPGQRTLCMECSKERKEEHAQLLKVVGPAALQRFRETGDPDKQATARAAIGRKTAASNRRRAEWTRDHGRQDMEIFRTQILPGLVGVPTSKIAEATGLSRSFAATIKSGKHAPHPIHWDVLRELADRFG